MSPTTSFNKSAETEKKNKVLLHAVRTGDAEKITLALQNGADPNTQNGLPLRIAAENNDYLAAKKLMEHHADLGYALMRAEQENSAIPREIKGSGLFAYSTPKTIEGSGLEQQLLKQIGHLKTFHKTYIESSLPQEQMNLLRDMNARLIRLEKQVKELTEPQKLEKSGTKLAAPTPTGKP